MRGALTVVAVMFVAAMLTGMGSLGGTPEGAVPKAEEDITARLVDRSGVTTDLRRFSMGGKVYFEGRRGDGVLSVFFRDIKEVTFGTVSGDDVPAELLLKAGNRVQINMRKDAVFNGDTGYGAYWIQASGVSRIVFHEISNIGCVISLTP